MADRTNVAVISANRLRSKKEDGGVHSIKAEKTDMDATEKAKLGSVAGLGLGKGSSGAGMPKQSDYSSTAAWSEAMRKWREGKRTESAQKKALGGM